MKQQANEITKRSETVAEDGPTRDGFDDLQLTDEQERAVKAGTGWGSSMYQYAYNDPNGRPPAASSLVKP